MEFQKNTNAAFASEKKGVAFSELDDLFLLLQQ